MDIVHESKGWTYCRSVEIDHRRGTVKVTVISREKGGQKRSICILDKTYTVANGGTLTPGQLERVMAWSQIDFLGAMIEGMS
jgi:hypothetical protein